MRFCIRSVAVPHCTESWDLILPPAIFFSFSILWLVETLNPNPHSPVGMHEFYLNVLQLKNCRDSTRACSRENKSKKKEAAYFIWC